MSKFKEGDTVRITGRTDVYQVSSVIDRLSLVYLRDMNDKEVGYMHQEKIHRVEQRWQAGEHLSSCKRYVEQRANGEPIYSFYVTRLEWKKESSECGCGGLCAQNSESELNNQLTLFQ